eukprot:1158472-Pelagomonas_calceolata.AAC.7
MLRELQKSKESGTISVAYSGSCVWMVLQNATLSGFIWMFLQSASLPCWSATEDVDAGRRQMNDINS